MTLWRVAALTALCATSGLAQRASPAGTTSIAGVVTDVRGRPLDDAEVRLLLGDSISDIAHTNDSGRFVVRGVPLASSRLQARRIGYAVREVALNLPFDSTRTVRIALDPLPATLAGVDVVERNGDVTGWLRDFDERRRTNSFGRFFTRDDIARRSARHLSDLLRSIPGVSFIAVREGYLIRMRGCRLAPIVWIDGLRAPRAELDEVMNLNDVAGLEVYTSVAGVPAKFMDRSNAGCGTIVIWTRQQ